MQAENHAKEVMMPPTSTSMLKIKNPLELKGKNPQLLTTIESPFNYYIAIKLSSGINNFKLSKQNEIKLQNIPFMPIKSPFFSMTDLPMGFEHEKEIVDYYNTFRDRADKSICSDFYLKDFNRRIFSISQKNYLYFQAMTFHPESTIDFNFLQKSNFAKNEILLFTKHSVDFEDFTPLVQYEDDELLFYVKKNKKIIFRRKELSISHQKCDTALELGDYIETWLRLKKTKNAIFLNKKKVYDLQRLKYFDPYKGLIIKYKEKWYRGDLKTREFYKIIYKSMTGEASFKLEEMTRVKLKLIRYKEDGYCLVFMGMRLDDMEATGELNIILLRVLENFENELVLEFKSRKTMKVDLEEEFFKSFGLDENTAVLEVIRGKNGSYFEREYYFLTKEFEFRLIEFLVDEEKYFSVEPGKCFDGVAVSKIRDGCFWYNLYE